MDKQFFWIQSVHRAGCCWCSDPTKRRRRTAYFLRDVLKVLGTAFPGAVDGAVRTDFPSETAPQRRRWGPLARRQPSCGCRTWKLWTWGAGCGGMGAGTRGNLRVLLWVLSSLPAAQCCGQVGRLPHFFLAGWKYKSHDFSAVTRGLGVSCSEHLKVG